MIRCVVFDFDGTLINSNEIKQRAYRDTLSDLVGAESFIDKILSESPDGTRREVISHCLECLAAADHADVLITPETIDAFVQHYDRICIRRTSACEEIPGASWVLNELRMEYPLYINSGTPEVSLRTVVRNRSWDKYFKGVFGLPTTKVDNLVRIMRREMVEPDEFLFVGDRSCDLQASQLVGCPFVGVASPGGDLDCEVVTCLSAVKCLPNVLRRL